jgi:hypothetical protein
MEDKNILLKIHIQGPFTITYWRSIGRWWRNRMHRRAMKKLLKWFDLEEMKGYRTNLSRNDKKYAVYVVKADDQDGLLNELDSLNESVNTR